MKTLILHIIAMFSLKSCPQTPLDTMQKLPLKYVEIQEPIINKSLRVAGGSHCKFSETNGCYLVNANYVIYQDCDSLHIFYPDMATFKRFKHFGQVLATDKNHIYYRGKPMPIATEGFEVVAGKHRSRDKIGNYYGEDYFWKTDQFAFFGTQKLDVAHPKTFRATQYFNGNDFEDEAYFYYIDFDKKTPIFEKIAKTEIDSTIVYHQGKKLYYEGEVVKRVNRVLYKTSKYVLINTAWSGEAPVLEKATGNFDAETLQGLSPSYSKDKNHVYCGIAPVPIASDRLAFVKVFDQVNSQYVTDGRVIYQNDSILRKGLDAATFGMFPKSDFYYDKHGIYKREYDEKTESLVNIKMPFIYKEPVSLQTATYVNNHFIYGNQVVYPWGDTPQLFKNLTDEQLHLIKTTGAKLTNINDKVFVKEVFDYNLYRANNTIYWDGKPLQADAKTFTSEGFFFKDKDHLYQFDREEGLFIVKNVSPSSFKMTRNGLYDDGEYLYHFDQKLIRSEQWELLAIYAGYRLGCSLDTNPVSDYYLFKNSEGYHLVEISDEVQIRFLGKTLPKRSETYILTQ
ncbi:DKNYY family protein [Capnocytophaga canimorsus]|uniref:DKNYY family protein n=1 Tax=Capnocytophaga canimorsus TaxID=28188 RepID=UPI00385847F6